MAKRRRSCLRVPNHSAPSNRNSKRFWWKSAHSSSRKPIKGHGISRVLFNFVECIMSFAAKLLQPPSPAVPSGILCEGRCRERTLDRGLMTTRRLPLVLNCFLLIALMLISCGGLPNLAALASSTSTVPAPTAVQQAFPPAVVETDPPLKSVIG